MTVSAVPPGVVADAAAAAGAWLRAADGQDAASIASLCVSAIALAEAFCGQVLIARAGEQEVPANGTWAALTATPVTAITGVAAVTADGTSPLPPVAYAIDLDAGGTGWVRAAQPVAAERLTVSFVAGEARGWADVPAPIAQGIAMLVAHLFDNRGGDASPPAAVAALWRPWRRVRLAQVRLA